MKYIYIFPALLICFFNQIIHAQPIPPTGTGGGTPVGITSSPVVTTSSITIFDNVSATMGGNVTSDGGATVTERGVTYSSSDTDPEIGDTGVTQDSNGTGTGSFSESISGLAPNTTYYVKAYATNSEGTSYGSVETFTTDAATSSTYTGTGNWSDAANWSEGIPETTTDVIIAGNCTVDADYEVTDMTINSGAVISVNPGNVLTVSGALTNNAGISGLVLQSDATGTGMLMNNSTGVLATVKQFLVKNLWHYIGIPVTYVPDLSSVFSDCYVIWNEEAEAYNGTESGWYYLGEGDSLLSLHGYGLRYGWPGQNEKANDTTITFTGTLNAGVVDTIFASEFYGWNFISNPYPVTIDWDASGGKTLTNTLNAIYLWNPDLNSGTGAYGSYGSYISGGSTNGQTQYIAPMQGFFIQVWNVYSAISFNDNAKIAHPVALKDATLTPMIRLAVTDNDVNYDEMLLREKAEATMNFDGNYDAGKIKALESKQPLLYSVLDGEEYSINSIPQITEETVIPLKVLVKTTGTQKLELTELKSYSYSYPIVLFDAEGNKVANLETEDYSFEGLAGETKTFFLGFSEQLVTSNVETKLSSIQLFSKDKDVVISGLNNVKSSVRIFNLVGQMIYNDVVQTNEVTIPLTKTGVYLVSVSSEIGVPFTKKVFIK